MDALESVPDEVPEEAPRADVFWNPLITRTGERREYLADIEVPLTTEIGIPRIPGNDSHMRKSGFGFLAYFENHEKRMEKLSEVGSGIMDGIRLAEGKIAKQQSDIDRVEGQPESKKVKAIRKKGPKRIRKYQRRIRELEVHYEVSIQAWNNGFFQYCQVAYDVWAKNSLFHGNDALGLYVGELNMRSPYGEIDTKMMKQVAKTNVVKAQLERMA